MADLPSEPAVDARLRDFLEAELRQAELDFPHLQRPERLPERRHLPIGILAAAVGVLAFVVVAPRFLESMSVATGWTAGPSASVALASATPSPQVSAPPASATPGSASAAPTRVSPPSLVDCGRISPAACAKSVALARAGNEAEVVGATRIVVDDTCPPDTLGVSTPTAGEYTTVMCDRLYPFDSVVVFVTAGADTTGWYAFNVVGLEYDAPTKAEPWLGDLPAHVVQRLLEPQSTP
jgi:hypothetical protein